MTDNTDHINPDADSPPPPPPFIPYNIFKPGILNEAKLAAQTGMIDPVSPLNGSPYVLPLRLNHFLVRPDTDVPEEGGMDAKINLGGLLDPGIFLEQMTEHIEKLRGLSVAQLCHDAGVADKMLQKVLGKDDADPFQPTLFFPNDKSVIVSGLLAKAVLAEKMGQSPFCENSKPQQKTRQEAIGFYTAWLRFLHGAFYARVDFISFLPETDGWPQRSAEDWAAAMTADLRRFQGMTCHEIYTAQTELQERLNRSGNFLRKSPMGTGVVKGEDGELSFFIRERKMARGVNLQTFAKPFFTRDGWERVRDFLGAPVAAKNAGRGDLDVTILPEYFIPQRAEEKKLQPFIQARMRLSKASFNQLQALLDYHTAQLTQAARDYDIRAIAPHHLTLMAVGHEALVRIMQEDSPMDNDFQGMLAGNLQRLHKSVLIFRPLGMIPEKALLEMYQGTPLMNVWEVVLTEGMASSKKQKAQKTTPPKPANSNKPGSNKLGKKPTKKSPSPGKSGGIHPTTLRVRDSGRNER